MKNTISTLLLSIFLLSFFTSFAQFRYKDYRNQKSYVFEEDFNNNQHQWESLNTATTDVRIDNGFLFFDGKSRGWNKILIPQYIDESRSFEIETRFRFVIGNDTKANAILWGSDNNNALVYGLETSSFSKYCNGRIFEGKAQLEWERGKKIEPRRFNKLTIRKVGGQYYFFLNEKLTRTQNFQPFYGQHIGFAVHTKVRIQIDYLTIAYIDGLGSPKIPSDFLTSNDHNLEDKKEPIENQKTEETPTIPEPKKIIKLKKPSLVRKGLSDPNLKLDGDYDIEFDLPKTKNRNPDGIAVIIGNSNYQKAAPVNYAIEDAKTMEKYLTESLGFASHNIIYIEDATKNDLELVFGQKGNHKGKLYNYVKKDVSDVFIFYAGHGAPSLKSENKAEGGEAYLVPIDSDPSYLELTSYSLEVFYQNLNAIPAKNITVVMDACFSGAEVYQNISSVGIRVKKPKGLTNGTVLSSSAGQQASTWYNGKSHGLFTYFFLKAIHNKNADANNNREITLKEIFDYVANENEGVPYYARRINGVEQKPTLTGTNKDWVLVKY